ncbi:ATP-dependent zinc metalloprotease FtsH [Candidatus Hydrogenosomobacter endosymbioticus]|uniref:ATP-dependent zinc metalloprotease FtsH n=1 Tax=Candidatus Hydrogenosomobacter endosymbioticus TaxID=2558174 RepID=UPI003AF4C6B0
MRNNGKNVAIWTIIVLLVISVFNVFHGGAPEQVKAIEFSDFISKVNSSDVKEVTIRGESLVGEYKSGGKFSTYIPYQYKDLIQNLINNKVFIKTRQPESPAPSLLQVFLTWLPLILLGGIWFFFFRPMHNSNGRAMGFGRSRAQLSDPNKNPTTFSDVEGIDEAKQDLEEIVEFLRDPHRFQKIGGKIPRGVLLVGPPGTGKTLLARAVSGEARVPFFSISGSDFVEMFVGVGASRVRDLFEQAKRQSPCIVFIDEIDAVGRNRGIGVGGGNDEREQTLNQLLVEMDGFSLKEQVIVLAATNRADVLDQALLRPGRFDRQVYVGLPDVGGREKILQLYMKRIKASDDVSCSVLARGTPGFSGADLANLVNEAALLAARNKKKIVGMKDFEESKDKLIMGPKRRSSTLSLKEREIVAVHESGHAIAAFFSKESDPIHKVTIIQRGSALGVVIRIPERDHSSVSKNKLWDDIVVAMAGRAAEEAFFGEGNITTGAASDFRMATRIANKMVREWGMSALSLVAYGGGADADMYNPFAKSEKISEEMMSKIDKEVEKIVTESYAKAKGLIETYRDKVRALADSLLVYETLSGEQVKEIISMGSLSSVPGAAECKPKKKKAARAVRNNEGSESKSSETPSPRPTSTASPQLQEG